MPSRVLLLILVCLYGNRYASGQYTPREADVNWSRVCWRLIDLREKQNLHLYYAPEQGGQSLLSLVRDALLQQTVAAYDPLYGDFRLRLTLPEITARWTETRYLKRQRPYPPYAGYDTIAIKSLDPGSIKHIKIKEYVFFDARYARLETRIIGLCPVMERYDPKTHELRGYSDMFWIYFPELKPILAAHRLSASMGSLTFYDVFQKRYFSSHIYKEDNAYERGLPDYLRQSMDVLLESERIKESIRLYEEDWWEQ